ncbi:MAG: hypothetical protein GXP46_07425 [Deferribacteres bacterium]|nr:hypothetical protein [Deferribacteres bacterium]
MIFRLLKAGALAVVLFIISLTLIYFLIPKVVDVQEIQKYPGAFKGRIGVLGEVYSINEDSSSFLLLDCEKKIPCVTIPVVYNGRIPGVTSEIIVYGRIRRAKGSGFIETFEAERIYARRDDFTGNLFYSTRKKIRHMVREFRRLLYSHCSVCLAIKKKLMPDTIIR